MLHNFFALLFTFIIGMFLFGIPLRIALRKRVLLDWACELPYYVSKLTNLLADCRKKKSYPYASDLIFLIQLPHHMDFYVLNHYWERDTLIDGNFFGLFRYNLKPFVEDVAKLKDKATRINCDINASVQSFTTLEGSTKFFTTITPPTKDSILDQPPLGAHNDRRIEGVVLKSSKKGDDLEKFIEAIVECMTSTIAVSVDYIPIVRKEVYFWSAISAIGLFTTLFIGASLVQ